MDKARVGDLKGEAKAGVAFEVAEEVAELGPVVFLGVVDARCEEGAGSCYEEEDTCYRAMEDLHLLFREWAACVVVVDSKEMLTCRGFRSFAEVFREFFDDVSGVFSHAEGDLVGDRVVDVHA